MRVLKLLVLFLILFFLPMSNIAQDQQYFDWSTLPPFPDEDGWAGSYVGVSNGALLIAGGTNFPSNTRPWNNGKKTWYSKILALETPQGDWKEVGSLPAEMGYGIALSYNNSLLCLGGGDALQNYADVFMLTYQSGQVKTVKLPDMPAPLINACAVIVKDVVFIAGGIKTPTAKTEKIFWSLDLSAPAKGWKILPDIPGPSRMLATAGTADGKVYLFGGVELTTAPGDSTLRRSYLKDCWEYTPSSGGWKRIQDMPNPVAAAPTPAYNAGQSHLMLFGGDDGKNAANVATLKDEHPGFSSDILAYNTITDIWSVTGKIPVNRKEDAASAPHNSVYAPVTTPLVVWNNDVVLAGGEVRPAVRTNRVLVAAPQQPKGSFGWLDWSVIALYFLAVIGISVYVSRNMGSSTTDFFLGGQKIPWWAAGLSIFGSKLSALTFIAIPAKAYATDWVFIMNNVMILVVAPIVTMFYLPYFRKLKITSVYEYLEIRFNRKVKLLGSFTFVVFQLSRLGVVIYLPALVLSTVTGINIFTCIIVTTLITTAYSVAGGIEAVVWTEVMQVFVLLGGALAGLLFISNHSEGGFSGLISEAYANDKFKVANLGWSISQPVLWVVAVGAFLTNLVTYTSDQVVVQRYLTTSTEKEARRSIYTNAVMVIPASLIFFGVGTALWVYFRQHPQQLNPHGRIDDVFPWFISHELPSGLSGLVIAGLFAATMSTISSSMNSIATVVTTDFYKPFRKTATDKESLRFAKWFTVLLGIGGCFIAIYLVYLQNASIWDQYLKIIGLFGGCLAGMFMAGIFFKGINSTGILIGFIISSITLYFIQQSEAINFFLYPVFAVIGCVVTGYIFSLFFPSGKTQTV